MISWHFKLRGLIHLSFTRGYSSTGEHLAGSQRVLGSNPSSSTMKEINLENLEEFVERMHLLNATHQQIEEALEEEFGLRTFEVETLDDDNTADFPRPNWNLL